MKKNIIISDKAKAKLPNKGKAFARNNRLHFSGVPDEEMTRLELEFWRDINRGIKFFWSRPHRKHLPNNPYVKSN